jgi:hypothetical protein
VRRRRYGEVAKVVGSGEGIEFKWVERCVREKKCEKRGGGQNA